MKFILVHVGNKIDDDDVDDIIKIIMTLIYGLYKAGSPKRTAANRLLLNISSERIAVLFSLSIKPQETFTEKQHWNLLAINY